MRTKGIDPSELARFVRANGAVRSRDVQDHFDVSQPTASRALRELAARGEVVPMGATNNQVYVAHAPRPGVSSPVPIIRVDESGAVHNFGDLVPTTSGQFWFSPAKGPGTLHGGLPWFITDMRPQGFMGRAFARQHPNLGLPPQLRHWTEDQALTAMTAVGADLPGNLVLGAPAIDAFLQLQGAQGFRKVTSPDAYPALADAAINGEEYGSSAGGEQPKFGVVRDGVHRLVKFSPSDNSATSQRMRDLLVCEHLSGSVLDGVLGLRVARSSIHQEVGKRLLVKEVQNERIRLPGRLFLDVERFDRTPSGRIGMVSLESFDSEFVGLLGDWATSAKALAQRGHVSTEDAQRMALLDAFGRLIANTDRHFGNISLLRESDRWVLAPVYDMLPMAYYPVNNELPDRDFDPGGLVATASTHEVWSLARALATQFWVRVSEDTRISAGFRAIAAEHHHSLSPSP